MAVAGWLNGREYDIKHNKLKEILFFNEAHVDSTIANEYMRPSRVICLKLAKQHEYPVV